MNDNEEQNVKPVVRARGRMMDFAPRGANANAPKKKPQETDEEKRRHELAKREVARREEIARQIERQKEQDLINERRAIAARRDLARRLEVEKNENAEALAAHEKELELRKERVERARKRAMIEARAMKERQRMIAERRAKAAREELERRREAESMMRNAPAREIRNPRGSRDPLARPVVHPVERPVERPIERPIRVTEPEPEEEKEEEEPKKHGLFGRKNKVEKRLGSVEDFEAELNDLENETEALEEEENDDVDAFVDDEKEKGFLDDIDEIEKEVEEDTSRNNDRYVLGGRSPFINTEVEKRPLSGGNRTLESTATLAAAPTSRLGGKPMKARGRYVPYNEPIPHKNIYARTVAKEKKNKDVPTMVVGDAPKTSKVSLIIAILLTIILGATVGAIAYLALFQ